MLAPLKPMVDRKRRLADPAADDPISPPVTPGLRPPVPLQQPQAGLLNGGDTFIMKPPPGSLPGNFQRPNTPSLGGTPDSGFQPPPGPNVDLKPPVGGLQTDPNIYIQPPAPNGDGTYAKPNTQPDINNQGGYSFDLGHPGEPLSYQRPARPDGGGQPLNFNDGRPYTGGTGQPAGYPAIDPKDDLRGKYIGPNDSGRLQSIRGGTDSALADLKSYGGVPGYTPINAMADAGVEGNLRGAEDLVGGAGLKNYGSIAPTDLGGAYDQLSRVEGDLNTPGYAFKDINTPGSYNANADTINARGVVNKGLSSLDSAPSRQEIALQSLRAFEGDLADERKLGIDQIGQSAARLGRLGMGKVGTSLGDLEERLGTTREREIARLSADTADKELGDRLAKLNAGQGVYGQLSGEDQSQAGVEQSLRGEARTERQAGLTNAENQAQLGLSRGNLRRGLASDLASLGTTTRGELTGERGFQAGQDQARSATDLNRAGALSSLSGQRYTQGQGIRNEARGERSAGLDYSLSDLGARQSRLNSLSGLEETQANREATNRGEVRGERTYQNDLSDKAMEDRVRQQLLEEELTQGAFGRNLDEARLKAGISSGYANDASGAYDVVQQALADLARRKALGDPAAKTPVTPYDSGMD